MIDHMYTMCVPSNGLYFGNYSRIEDGIADPGERSPNVEGKDELTERACERFRGSHEIEEREEFRRVVYVPSLSMRVG